MNFAESLGYWYFRLNGFIPMSNFVLHEFDPPRKYNADADLLAVRFPHVFEEVGGQQHDWDNGRFDRWGLDHLRRVVCVLCEVKTGGHDAQSINKSFAKQRLIYAVRRLGMTPEEECGPICEQLMNSAVVRTDGFTFAKVLMSSTSRQNGGDEEMTPCCKVEVSDAVRFIERRMTQYADQKAVARMFFPGDLIQFFAWSAGVPMSEQTAGDRE